MNSSLPLEAKIGQLLIFGFYGKQITPFLQRFIIEKNLGGVIHFARNIESARQLAQLNSKFQLLARESPSKVGLFIATDQEGGNIARLTRDVAVAPNAMALGATASEECTEKVYAVSGSELRSCGINMNLAPVLDVNNNPLNPVIGIRSFGEDPHQVARLGAAAIRGYQRHVAAVAKHFPGHGDTHLDSHHELPIIAHDRRRLESVELVPFRAAIEAQVAGIMTAHVEFPAIEPKQGRPATVSYQVLTKLLREDLGFDGLIMTDCMEMMAIQGTFGTAEAAVLAVEAGADLVLVSHSEDLQQQAFNALLKAVRTGRISEQRIDESLARVMRAKERFNLIGNSNEEFDVGRVGCGEHMRVMQEAIRSSLTLVQAQGSNLPVGNERILVVQFEESASTIAEDVLVGMGTLAQALRKKGLTQVEEISVGDLLSSQEQQEVVSEARVYDKILVVTADAHRNPVQARLVKALAQSHDKVIVVGTRTPYELQAFPEVPTYIAAYGSRPLVWDEVAKLLLGQFQAQGHLPVTVPGLKA